MCLQRGYLEPVHKERRQGQSLCVARVVQHVVGQVTALPQPRRRLPRPLRLRDNAPL